VVKKVVNERVGFVENLYPYEELKIFVHNLLCIVAAACLCYNQRMIKKRPNSKRLLKGRGWSLY